MSGRTTAEIEAVLRDLAESEIDHEAADRLAELAPVEAHFHALMAEMVAIDALRPPCPTCGGKKGAWSNDGQQHRWVPCPENGGNCDGKVTIERLVAVFNAVMDEEFDEDTTDSRRCAFLYLRSVR